MRYCGPRGIPHSHFLGGPPVWSALDRDKALWWLIHDSETCPECGTRPEEWAEWEPEDGDRGKPYLAELRKCWGCQERSRLQERVTDDMGAGVWVALNRTGRP